MGTLRHVSAWPGECFPQGTLAHSRKIAGVRAAYSASAPTMTADCRRKFSPGNRLFRPVHAEILYLLSSQSSLCNGVGKRVAGEFNEGRRRALGGVQASMICGEAVHGASWARPRSPRGTLDKRAFSLISSYPGVRERSMDGRECLASVSMRVLGRRLRP